MSDEVGGARLRGKTPGAMACVLAAILGAACAGGTSDGRLDDAANATVAVRLAPSALHVMIVDTVCGTRVTCPSPFDRLFVGNRTGGAYFSGVKSGLSRLPGGEVARYGDGPGEIRGASHIREERDSSIRILSRTTPRLDRIYPSSASARNSMIGIAWGITTGLTSHGAVGLLQGAAGSAGDSTTDVILEQRDGAEEVDTIHSFRVRAGSPVAASRGLFQLPGLFVGVPQMSVSVDDDIIITDGVGAVVLWWSEESRQTDRLELPLSPRPVERGDLETERDKLLALPTPGKFAAQWRADVARRLRDASGTRPMVLELGYATATNLLLRIDAVETGGERWVILARHERTLRLIDGEWSLVGGFDRTGRLLLCVDELQRTVCGWSAPVGELGK